MTILTLLSEQAKVKETEFGRVYQRIRAFVFSNLDYDRTPTKAPIDLLFKLKVLDPFFQDTVDVSEFRLTKVGNTSSDEKLGQSLSHTILSVSEGKHINTGHIYLSIQANRLTAILENLIDESAIPSRWLYSSTTGRTAWEFDEGVSQSRMHIVEHRIREIRNLIADIKNLGSDTFWFRFILYTNTPVHGILESEQAWLKHESY